MGVVFWGVFSSEQSLEEMKKLLLLLLGCAVQVGGVGGVCVVVCHCVCVCGGCLLAFVCLKFKWKGIVLASS